MFSSEVAMANLMSEATMQYHDQKSLVGGIWSLKTCSLLQLNVRLPHYNAVVYLIIGQPFRW